MSARAVTGTVPLSGGRGGPRLGPLEQGLDLCPERCHSFRSTSASFANASGSRIPARSLSRFQCSRV